MPYFSDFSGSVADTSSQTWTFSNYKESFINRVQINVPHKNGADKYWTATLKDGSKRIAILTADQTEFIMPRGVLARNFEIYFVNNLGIACSVCVFVELSDSLSNAKYMR